MEKQTAMQSRNWFPFGQKF